MEAWWMNFSFRLSIYHRWFPCECGQIRWPCWSYTTWVFRVFPQFSIVKWGHSESQMECSEREVQQCAVRPHPHSPKKAAVHGTAAVEWATCNGPIFQLCQNHLIFPGNALTLGKWVDSCIGIYLFMGNSQWQHMATVDGAICMTFLGHNVGFPYGMQQSKVWQVISCFALVHFATKTSRSSRRSQEGS